MEHKTLAFEVKAVDYEGRTLEGYAAAFGNIDQVGDIIHPGAFRKTLQERGQRIKVLWQHDPTEPIGKLVEAREDGRGLYVKAIISDTTRGRDALALLRDGAIGEMSIGYDSVKGATDYSKMEGKTVRNLREIKLYEFSLVTFPANEQAVVTALKQDEKMDFVSDEQRRAVFANLAERGEAIGGENDLLGIDEGMINSIADNIKNGKGEYTRDDIEKNLESARRNSRDYRDEIRKARESGDNSAVDKASRMLEFYQRQGRISQAIIEKLDNSKFDIIADEVKSGRTISRATLERLKAARSVIDELCSMGDAYDADDDEQPEEMKSAPGGVPQAAEEQHEEQAGPVKPPTDAKRLLLEIEILESQLHTLEV